MKYRTFFAGILLILIPVLAFYSNPDQLIWVENFDETTARWRTSNSLDELFLIQDGEYILHRKNTGGPGIILPEEGDLFGDCRVEMRMRFEEGSTGSSGGMLVMAKADASSAYILEINDRREYRVRHIADGVFRDLTGTAKNAGWIKEKTLARNGTHNLLSATYENGVLKFSVNGSDLWIQDVYQQEKGRVGIYIGPSSRMRVDAIRVYVSEEEAERVRRDRENQDPVRSELTGIIITLRNTINAQNKEIDSLHKVSARLQSELNKFDNSPRNVKKLSAEIATLKKDLAALNTKIKKLESEKAQLQRFKDNIQKNSGGDIVIKLSNALNEEQQKSQQLESENAELKARLRALELELEKYKTDEQE